MKYLKPFGSQSFVVGIGIAALAYLFGPTIKRGAKTVAVKGMQGALIAGESATNAVEGGKQKASDFINNLVTKQGNNDEEFSHIYRQMVNELKTQREQNNNVMKELVETMKGMQTQMNKMSQNVSSEKPEQKTTK